jgi:hypothetical protein
MEFEMSNWDGFDKLIGKKVVRVFAAKGGRVIGFEDDGGLVTAFSSEGDCCSVSWFEHVTGLDNLLGHTVISEARLELPEPAQPEDGLIQAYGYRLTTDKGYFEIEMRNESNGYYGGWVEESAGAEAAPEMKDDF